MPSKTSTHKPIATPVDLMREVNNNRHEALQDLWGQYQIGDLDYGPCLPSKSHLELISGDHLQVRFAREEFLNTIGTMEVRNLDSPDCLGMNFMGYDQRTRCLAFRGEARNLDGFLEFANGIVNSEKVEHVFKFASEVQVPEGGLEPGLEYDDFAGRVEIVEYAMLLKEAEDERDDGRETYTVISIMEDGTQIALPAKEEESNTADESIPELQLEPLQGTEDAQIDDAPGEHPTGDADNIPNEDPYHTSEGELSLVPAALEEHDVQQQIARDATIAAAIAAQPNTRYTLRAQSRSTVTPSPSKPPPPRPTPWKTTPQKTTPRTKREVAQRKKPKCR